MTGYFFLHVVECRSPLTHRNFLILIMECPIEDQCLLLWPKVGLDQADQVLGLENPKLIPNSLLTPICGIRRPQGPRAQALPRSEGKEDRHQHLSNEKRKFISASILLKDG